MFNKTQHLFNPWNEGKPVKIGRDGQEIEMHVAAELCRLFPTDQDTDWDLLTARMKDTAKKGYAKIVGPMTGSWISGSGARLRGVGSASNIGMRRDFAPRGRGAYRPPRNFDNRYYSRTYSESVDTKEMNYEDDDMIMMIEFDAYDNSIKSNFNELAFLFLNILQCSYHCGQCLIVQYRQVNTQSSSRFISCPLPVSPNRTCVLAQVSELQLASPKTFFAPQLKVDVVALGKLCLPHYESFRSASCSTFSSAAAAAALTLLLVTSVFLTFLLNISVVSDCLIQKIKAGASQILSVGFIIEHSIWTENNCACHKKSHLCACWDVNCVVW